MEANLRHIARHEAKPNPKPQGATSITRAFEAAAYPKIVSTLGDANLVVRQKALLAARELLGNGVSYVQCIAAGITPAVVLLLQDADAVVRERAAGTTQYIAVKEVGAADLRQHGAVALLVSLLEDSEVRVRDAAYGALTEAVRFNGVRAELVSLNTALPALMRLVLSESEGRSLAGLVLLNACAQVRHPKTALQQLVDDAASIPALSNLLDPGVSTKKQEQAAMLLVLVVSNFDDAKIEAVTAGCVLKLLALVGQSHDTLLAAAAASALMNITVVREGKYAVIAAEGGLETLTARLEPSLEQLCTSVCQTIANVAEAPEARPVLAEAGASQKLLAICKDEKYAEVVRRSAAEAYRLCKFSFLPYALLPGRTVDPKNFPEPVAPARPLLNMT